jgi:hypothetical protein
LQVATGDQFLDQQARHDGLACTRIVRQQEPERLARQHRLVDGRDLVRQRLDDGCVDGENGVEQVCEANPLRLGYQPEQAAVAVEAPRPSLFDNLEPRLVIAIQQFVRDLAGGRLVRELEGFRTEPLHADDGDEAVREDAADRGVGREIVKLGHAKPVGRFCHRTTAGPGTCGLILPRKGDRAGPGRRPPGLTRLATPSGRSLARVR